MNSFLAVDALMLGAEPVDGMVGRVALSGLKAAAANDALFILGTEHDVDNLQSALLDGFRGGGGVEAKYADARVGKKISYCYKGVSIFCVNIREARTVGIWQLPKHENLHIFLDENRGKPSFSYRVCSFESLCYIAGALLDQGLGKQFASAILRPQSEISRYVSYRADQQSVISWLNNLYCKFYTVFRPVINQCIEVSPPDEDPLRQALVACQFEGSVMPEPCLEAVGFDEEMVDAFYSKVLSLKKKGINVLSDVSGYLNRWYETKEKAVSKKEQSGKKKGRQQGRAIDLDDGMMALNRAVDSAFKKPDGFPDIAFSKERFQQWLRVKRYKNKEGTLRTHNASVPYMGERNVDIVMLNNATNFHFQLVGVLKELLDIQPRNALFEQYCIKDHHILMSDLLMKWSYYNKSLKDLEAYESIVADSAHYINQLLDAATGPSDFTVETRIPDMAFAFMVVLREGVDYELSVESLQLVYKAISALYHYSSLRQDFAMSSALIDCLASVKSDRASIDSETLQQLQNDTMTFITALNYLIEGWDGDNRAYVDFSYALIHELSPLLEQLAVTMPLLRDTVTFDTIKSYVEKKAQAILSQHDRAVKKFAEEEYKAEESLKKEREAKREAFLAGLRQSTDPHQRNDQNEKSDSEDDAPDDDFVMQAPCLWEEKIPLICKAIKGAQCGNSSELLSGKGKSRGSKGKQTGQPGAKLIRLFEQAHGNDPLAMARLWIEIGSAYIERSTLSGKVRALSRSINKTYTSLEAYKQQLREGAISRLPSGSIVSFDYMIALVEAYPDGKNVKQLVVDWKEGVTCCQKAQASLALLKKIPKYTMAHYEEVFLARFKDHAHYITDSINGLRRGKTQLAHMPVLRREVLKLGNAYVNKRPVSKIGSQFQPRNTLSEQLYVLQEKLPDIDKYLIDAEQEVIWLSLLNEE